MKKLKKTAMKLSLGSHENLPSLLRNKNFFIGSLISISLVNQCKIFSEDCKLIDHIIDKWPV